ncbi:FtsQ-type POTRA domain-containing protein [Azorhizobium sp. AG788]|uniref:cell division protein FtsQ/DivIB n=1 Tax=Azorhizobium sp. AG788 TaxID=2183897 RepID=UPI003138CCC7
MTDPRASRTAGVSGTPLPRPDGYGRQTGSPRSDMTVRGDRQVFSPQDVTRRDMTRQEQLRQEKLEQEQARREKLRQDYARQEQQRNEQIRRAEQVRQEQARRDQRRDDPARHDYESADYTQRAYTPQDERTQVMVPRPLPPSPLEETVYQPQPQATAHATAQDRTQDRTQGRTQGRTPSGARPAPGRASRHKPRPMSDFRAPSRLVLLLHRTSIRLSASRFGRRGGGILSALVIGGFVAYGVVLGGHVEEARSIAVDMGDIAANVAGFKITQVDLSGQNHVTPAEILSAAGIKSTTSLLLVDADATRQKLEEMPWIASASVRKLYPDRIEIAVVEREAYALWQVNGEIRVIAKDGMPIAPYSDDSRYVNLPIVVGEGAQKKVQEIVDALGRVPAVRDRVRAAILVAERRWTLKLRNGIDIRLPETGVDAALLQVADLDREKKLLTRDITIVDLRLPDRVVVRLSDTAADARMQMLKARAKAKKGAA